MFPFTINRLATSDAAAFRALRLKALRAHPESFGAAWEDETEQPEAWFAARIEDTAIFGGFTDGCLAGMAGALVPAGRKVRHKATLWGMYVEPGARGAGLAPALVARVIEHVREQVDELTLSVGLTNAAAIRLYRAAGFRAYAVEPGALKIGNQLHDELKMTLDLRRPLITA